MFFGEKLSEGRLPVLQLMVRLAEGSPYLQLLIPHQQSMITYCLNVVWHTVPLIMYFEVSGNYVNLLCLHVGVDTATLQRKDPHPVTCSYIYIH